jgi:inositol transport system substrate-binding protein
VGVDVQIEDAQNDVAKQLDQINNFIASGVTAIIVNPVDTSATPGDVGRRRRRGRAAGLCEPPADQPVTLPDNQAFVGSNEVESGTLETIEAVRQLGARKEDRGQRLCHAGRAVEPGRRAAHAGHL